MGDIHVLRLGHRVTRDKRVTTHVGLVARAFGARSITVHGPDAKVVESISDVAGRFGGSFTAGSTPRWKPWLLARKRAGDTVVHLTMYGIPLAEAAPRARDALARGDVTVVVGAEKVPGDLFALADLNVAVGNQPHSEVAALALLLDRVTEGAWEGRAWEGQVRIVPSEKGKVIQVGGSQ